MVVVAVTIKVVLVDLIEVILTLVMELKGAAEVVMVMVP